MSVCRRCGGSGRQLINVSPYKLKKCSGCNGWRTKNNGKQQKETFND